MEKRVHFVISQVGGCGKTSFSEYLMDIFGDDALGVDLGFPNKDLSSRRDSGNILNISLPLVNTELKSDYHIHFSKVFNLISERAVNKKEIILDIGVSLYMPLFLYLKVEHLEKRGEGGFFSNKRMRYHFLSLPNVEQIARQVTIMEKFLSRDSENLVEDFSFYRWVNCFSGAPSVSMEKEIKDIFIEGKCGGVSFLPEADRETRRSLLAGGEQEFDRHRISNWKKRNIDAIKESVT